MRSATSCFKYTVFRKDLARCWPLWTVYVLLWVVFYPLLMLVDRGNSLRWSYAFDLERWTLELPLELVSDSGMVMLAMAVGLAAAMVAFSYLFNPRACLFVHALPVRREGLFLSHWLAGAAMFTGSHLVVFGVTLVAQTACGGAQPGPLAALLGLLTLMCLFFYSFAVLCAAFTGHILAMPALYVIFNFLAAGLYCLVSWVVSTFLFGLTLSGLPGAVRALTPSLELDQWLTLDYSGRQPVLEGAWVVWAYAGAGLVLSVIALLLCRRRHLEMAGEVIAVGPLRPVFRYGFALCAALAGGCSLFVIFSLEGSITFVFLMVIWGVVGYYIASMLLAKSFRVFRRWRGAAGVALAVVALSGVISMDLLGLESRVPDPADVTRVMVSGLSSRPYDGASYLPDIWAEDPEDIALAVALHQAVVDHRDELRASRSSYTYDADHDATGFEVTYQLTSGRTLHRSYDYFYISSDGLDQPGSVESAAQALLDDRSILSRAYGLDDAEGGRPIIARVDGLYDEQGSYIEAELWETDYALETEQVQIEGTQAEDVPTQETVSSSDAAGIGVRLADADAMSAILQGVLADFDAGALGDRYLFESQQDARADRFSGVTLHLIWEKTERDEQGRAQTRSDRLIIALTAGARETLAALEAAGLLPRDTVLNNELGQAVWTGAGWASAG